MCALVWDDDVLAQVVGFQCGPVVLSGNTLFTCPMGSQFVDVDGGSYGHGAMTNVFTSWAPYCPMLHSVLEFHCTPCPLLQYSFEAGYSTGHPGEHSELTCHPCPIGGDCSGGLGRVVAMPGYWGGKMTLNDTTTVSFIPCPPGYCCTGAGTDWPCNDVDACANNRKGILCGECEDGYGEAFGAPVCVPDDECNDQVKFWVEGTLAIEALVIALLFSTGLFRCGCGSSRKSGLASLTLYFVQVGSAACGAAGVGVCSECSCR